MRPTPGPPKPLWGIRGVSAAINISVLASRSCNCTSASYQEWYPHMGPPFYSCGPLSTTPSNSPPRATQEFVGYNGAWSLHLALGSLSTWALSMGPSGSTYRVQNQVFGPDGVSPTNDLLVRASPAHQPPSMPNMYGGRLLTTATVSLLTLTRLLLSNMISSWPILWNSDYDSAGSELVKLSCSVGVILSISLPPMLHPTGCPLTLGISCSNSLSQPRATR
jgi:hypothetical protein